MKLTGNIPIFPPRRVLVTKMGHIGDVLLTTPFYKVLKSLFPGVHITALVYRGTEEMVSGCPSVDQVLVVEYGQRSFRQKADDNLKLIKALRKAKFDISFELSAGDRGTYMCCVAGAKLRVGFDSNEGHLRDRLLHIMLPREEHGAHEVENFLRQLSIFQRPFSAPPLDWHPAAETKEQAAKLLSAHALDNFILVHPTSRWMFKSWTPLKNAQVINSLNHQGWKVLLSAGPDPEELRFIQQILISLSAPSQVINLAGQLNLTLLGALIERARVFFGVDSAPMHLAAAMQTPTVALFGPSRERMWRPWRVKHQILAGKCPSRPCEKEGCNGSKVCDCLFNVPVEQVCQTIEQLLRGKTP